MEEIEKLRIQLAEMIESGKFSMGEIIRISKELDKLILLFDNSSKKYVC